MKIVQINATCGVGSTGKICVDISKLLTEQSIDNYILYSNKTNGYELGLSCSKKIYTKIQAFSSYVLGNYGFNSKIETKTMIEKLEIIKPDIVHLHNIHGHDCNLEILFSYFKIKKIKIIWTFHDCWSFTGYCTYFDRVECEKWKCGCENCIQYKKYSFLFDRSKELFQRKRELLSCLDMTIVTPSQWLADIVKQSFLQKHPVVVINNGIDLDIFKPTKSNFREKYNISQNKKILLGVAFDWGIRKGLDVFVELSKQLNSDKYQIVLVGTNEYLDKQLPKNILTIHRTQNQIELAEIYSAADIFINPTREENYPTVNIESIACGTPVITFETGGSPESIENETGIVTDSKNSLAIIEAVETICNSKKYDERECCAKARQFDKRIKYQEYINLYKSI